MSAKPPSVVSSDIKGLKQKLAGSYQAVLAAMEESGVDDPQQAVAQRMIAEAKASERDAKAQILGGGSDWAHKTPGGKELKEFAAFMGSAGSELARLAKGKIDIEDFARAKPSNKIWNDMMERAIKDQPLCVFTHKSNPRNSTLSDYLSTFIIRTFFVCSIRKKDPALARAIDYCEATLGSIPEKKMHEMGLAQVVATTKLFWEDWQALQNVLRLEAHKKFGSSRGMAKAETIGAARSKKNGILPSPDLLKIPAVGIWKSALDEFRKEYQKDTKKPLSPDAPITCALLVQDFPAGAERSHQLLERGLLAVCAYEATHHNWINEAQKKVIENSDSISRLREVLKDKTTNELFGVLHSLHQMHAEHEFLVCAALLKKEDLTELTKVLVDYSLSSSSMSEHHHERKPLRGIISDFFEAAQTRLYAKAPYVYEPPSLQR